jgi:hypothetical protein
MLTIRTLATLRSGHRGNAMSLEMRAAGTPRKRVSWINLLTVTSIVVLVGSEVFGAAYAGGWALAHLLGFEEFIYPVIAVFCGAGAYAMALLLKSCLLVDPVIVDADGTDRSPPG